MSGPVPVPYKVRKVLNDPVFAEEDSPVYRDPGTGDREEETSTEALFGMPCKWALVPHQLQYGTGTADYSHHCQTTNG